MLKNVRRQAKELEGAPFAECIAEFKKKHNVLGS